MRTQVRHFKEGIRKTSAIASCIVAATPVNLYLLTNARTCHIRKISIFNANAAATVVTIGTGLGGAFAQRLPNILAVNGQDLQLTEEQIPNVEFSATITVQASVAAAAPNDVRVQVEVEEFMGPSA